MPRYAQAPDAPSEPTSAEGENTQAAQGEDAGWDAYFDEAVDASNGKRHRLALFGMKPEELYDAQGVPQSEDAENALYALGKIEAAKQLQNRERN